MVHTFSGSEASWTVGSFRCMVTPARPHGWNSGWQVRAPADSKAVFTPDDIKENCLQQRSICACPPPTMPARTASPMIHELGLRKGRSPECHFAIDLSAKPERRSNQQHDRVAGSTGVRLRISLRLGLAHLRGHITMLQSGSGCRSQRHATLSAAAGRRIEARAMKR